MTMLYWGTGLAELRIETTIQAQNALRASSVDYADRSGVGQWIYKEGTRRKLYKHHRCFIQWTLFVGYDEFGLPLEERREGERVLHVLGSFRFSLSTV